MDKKTVTIYGLSDDLVVFHDGVVSDETRPGVSVVLTQPETGHGLCVTFRYPVSGDAVWSAEMCQVGDEIPIPDDWHIELGQHKASTASWAANYYSPVVRVLCPANTKVTTKTLVG